MNKILIRTVVLFIVLGLFILILFKSRSPFGKTNSSFASEPSEEITKIEFSEKGKILTLEKKGENWLINGKSEARKSGILYIIKILKDLKIKSPVSAEFFESEITRKNIIPVKVKVYEKRRILKTFLVYKTESNTWGNIMKIKEASKPFIVYVPGFEDNIGSGFTLNELFWQPYTVFNLLPSEIASVKLENSSDTVSSFSIVRQDNHYTLSGLAGKLSGWDSLLVVRYISYFAWVPFESWAFKLSDAEKKSIENKQPMYRIIVLTRKGRKIVLSLWGMSKGKSAVNEIDSDRLLGKTEERDELFIIRYFDIDPLLKKRSYFFHL
ncbi:MAG: hypothetical protein WA816_11590 [Bacteroidales bacterium]